MQFVTVAARSTDGAKPPAGSARRSRISGATIAADGLG
jgi:hypothetical protein